MTCVELQRVRTSTISVLLPAPARLQTLVNSSRRWGELRTLITSLRSRAMKPAVLVPVVSLSAV